MIVKGQVGKEFVGMKAEYLLYFSGFYTILIVLICNMLN